MKKNYIVTFEISSELEIEELKKSIIENNNSFVLENILLLTTESFYDDDAPQKCPPYQSTLRYHAKVLLKGDNEDGIEVFHINH